MVTHRQPVHVRRASYLVLIGFIPKRTTYMNVKKSIENQNMLGTTVVFFLLFFSVLLIV